MSTRDAPSSSTSTTPGQALATKQSWSASRGQSIMDPYPYPGTVLSDTFQNATGTWIGVGGSGAGAGLMNPSSTICANNPASGKSLQVTANAGSRYYAVRKFDITPRQKLGFNVFFCYDTPSTVAFINFEMQWRDVDHGLTHFAGYRYNTGLNRWEYASSTIASASGAWSSLPNAASTMASGAGAFHEIYFDVNYLTGTYDEFLSGQIGIANPGNTSLLIPTFTETTEAQRMELRLGVEASGAGAGNAWFADPAVFEVD